MEEVVDNAKVGVLMEQLKIEKEEKDKLRKEIEVLKHSLADYEALEITRLKNDILAINPSAKLDNMDLSTLRIYHSATKEMYEKIKEMKTNDKVEMPESKKTTEKDFSFIR